MKRILNVAVPAALAVAAFGANASELAPGDLGIGPVKAVAGTPAAPVARQPALGELAPGDLGAQRLVPALRAGTPRIAAPRTAVPPRVDPVVGA